MDGSTQGHAPDPAKRTAGSAETELSPGDVLGDGRYVIRQKLRSGIFAHRYEAAEQTGGQPIAIHRIRAEISSSPEVLAATLERAQASVGVRSPALFAVLEVQGEGPAPFIVTEPLQGNTLAELIARKRSTRGASPFPARTTLNLGLRLFGALATFHGHSVHGALTPSGILVGPEGEFVLADQVFAPAVAQAVQAHIWPEDAPLAPEVGKGEPASAASDIYAAGAILYQVAVGMPPGPQCPRPSQASPELSTEFDEIVARCLLPDPDARFASAETVRHALAACAESDTQASTSAPAKAPGQSLAQSLATGPTAPTEDEALAAALADTEERWLVTMNKLDYGPFSTAELVEQIQSDRVLPGHLVIDKMSGERHPLEEHPLFSDVADRARQVRDDRRRAHAEETHSVRERRRGVALYGLIGAGVLALGGAAYAIAGTLSDDDGGASNASVAAIDEEADLEVTMSTPEAQKPARRRRGGRQGGGATEALGYDETQSLDMASGDDGGERLSNAELNRTIQNYGGKLGACLTRTGSSRADIEFIVQGDGQVSGVRVNGKTSGPLASCIGGVMRTMDFPTFDGSRTRGTFDISL